MEKLLEKYNKECNITSKLANKIWKIGNTILLITMFLCIIFKGVFISALVLIVTFCFLYIWCEFINIRHIKKILGLKKVALIANKKKHRKTAYQELDKFQKDWITNYCKKNKLNTIDKLKILREELKQKREGSIIRYLNPVIVGSLLISVWEEGVDAIVEQVGLIYAILPLILSSVIISVIVTEILKQLKEQKEYMNSFKDYSGYTRLEQLLLYRILKSNK